MIKNFSNFFSSTVALFVTRESEKEFVLRYAASRGYTSANAVRRRTSTRRFGNTYIHTRRDLALYQQIIAKMANKLRVRYDTQKFTITAEVCAI